MAIGIDYKTFMKSTPIVFPSFYKSYLLKRKMRDEELWLQGKYNLEALMVALAHFSAGLSGKKSSAKYLKEPVMKNIGNNGALTEAEKQKAVDKFFAKEKARRINWKRNHKDGKE